MLGLLRELPLDVVAYIPGANSAVLKAQSASLRISSEPIDICTQLQYCDLAILNGTAGAGTQCLLSGVPLLLSPLFLEQIAFSRRVVELGAGIIAEPNCVERFAARLWMIFQDDRYRKAAKAFAACYASYDPEKQQREILDCVERVVAL